MNANKTNQSPALTRRDFVRTCALGASFLASGAVVGCLSTAPGAGSAHLTRTLDQDWLFGGKFVEGADWPDFNDAAFPRITLPHCVAKLSWQNWKVEDWQDIWVYRRHFEMPDEFRGRRVFLDFDRVMIGATPVINGHALPQHLGGYLPFSHEITEQVKGRENNLLAVIVDSTWRKDVPPEGAPKGPPGMDYFAPGGITGSVKLRAVPQIFITDVFAKPVKVLSPDRAVEITCTVDAAMLPDKPLLVRVEMLDGGKRIARVSQPLKLEKTGTSEIKLTLSNLGDVKLWDVDAPHLYGIVTTLLLDNRPLHDHRTRVGLREARFEIEGFFLNGRKLRLFGLNRHEIYPYVGMAMPARVMRRDAEILRHEFNCNIVRCSHYPQTEAFLDACDELGLMVWQEPPGWGHLGDDAWKELVVRDVREMIVRDRNHPAIVIWGVRVNESPNDPALYRRTTELAKTLDGTRATSGSMTDGSKKTWEKGWREDVFALDDYHSAEDGSVGIFPPVPGFPYMLAETVGQYSYGLDKKKGFGNKYRRAGDLDMQTVQAVYHAQAHDRAAGLQNFSGVIAWCAFEAGSPSNSYQGVKNPGVADVFRIPKLGATFYQAQINPQIRPVIKPSFYWDFGPKSPHGPGKRAAIFSNCDRLELFVGGKPFATAQPDRKNFPNLKYPPFFCDLEFERNDKPELRIDGYVGGQLALSKSFSSDPAQDQFILQADDAELKDDGSDATRLVFKVADKFGEARAFGGGKVAFELTGPGTIAGDNPFSLEESGGMGAIWVKSVSGGHGKISVKAVHSALGAKTVELKAG